jgi:copper chaperone
MDHDNCHVDITEKTFEGDLPAGLSQAQLQVGGMGCPNCAARVHNALLGLDGVFKAQVDLEQAMAEVLYDSQQVAPQALMLAIELIGKQTNHNYQAQLL